MKAMIFRVILSFLFTQFAVGEVLRVPSDYERIQLALDDIEEGDTILVAPGEYVESLLAPPMSFTMMGEMPIDSETTEFSIIDPAELLGSDTLKILRLTGGNARFENMFFRNGSQMREGRLQSAPGGVIGDTSVISVSFDHCIFDSVVAAISRVDLIRVSSCRFIGCLGAIYTGFWRGRLEADSSWFDGMGSLVNTQDGCSIDHCLFTHHGPSNFITGVGDSLSIKNCRFVGLGMMNTALLLRGKCGSLLANCEFEDIIVQGSVVEVLDSCYQQPDCAIRILNNSFIRCGGPVGIPSLGGAMIVMRCNNPERGYVATLDSNRIDSTQIAYGHASGIEVNASCRIENTVFGDLLSPNKPQIYHEGRGPRDTLIFGNNSFSRFFYGVEFSLLTGSFVDARNNWWGHESGPYHGDLNQNGLGAQVDDDILFQPWLTADPDSADTSMALDENENLPLSTGFKIVAYPNPFNAVTTLVIEVARAGEYKVVLYDVTGRVAANLFYGIIESSQRVSVDAAGLASGVYFTQLRGGDGVLAVGKVLLIR